MGTHNIGFNEDLTKIIFELSSNMHLISSAELATKDGWRFEIYDLETRGIILSKQPKKQRR